MRGIALALGFVGATSLEAQSRRLSERLDAATQASVVRLVEQARVRGLPTEPLLEKAMEGAAKRASSAAIERAMTRRLDRLQAARETLGESASAADIAAGASALDVGVPRDAIRALRAIRPDRSIAVPLAVLAELVAQGVPVPRASQMVAMLIRRGATEVQLVALGREIEADIALGAAPEAALDVRTRYLVAALPSRTTSGSVLTASPNPKPPRKP